MNFETLLQSWIQEWEPLHLMVNEKLKSAPSGSNAFSLFSGADVTSSDDVCRNCDEVKNKALQVTILAFGNDVSPEALQPLFQVISQSLNDMFVATLQFTRSPLCSSTFRYNHVWSALSQIFTAVRSLIEEIVTARHETDAPPHKTGMVMSLCDALKDSLTDANLDDRVLISTSIISSANLIEDAIAEMEDFAQLTQEESLQRKETAVGTSVDEVIWMGSTDELSPAERKTHTVSVQFIRIILLILKKFSQLCLPKEAALPISFLEKFVSLADSLSMHTDDIAFTLEPPQDLNLVKEAIDQLHSNAASFLELLLAPDSPILGKPLQTQFSVLSNLVKTSYFAFESETNDLPQSSSSSNSNSTIPTSSSN